MSVGAAKKNNYDQILQNQIEESIEEYLSERGSNDSVSIGDSFCEWILYNIFELREDEVAEAKEIGGKFDNGLDAVFEYNGEVHLLQSKYKTSHNIDSTQRFIADCQRICIEEPTTERDSVKEACKNVRESYQNDETINCYYITNNHISDWERMQIKSNLKHLSMEFKNLNFFSHDLDDIQESIEIKKGMLPKDFREKTFRMNIEENFSTFETTVAKVRVKDFSQFVNEGENLLFHSNIRNYLKSTKINKGIKHTIRNEPENFWYYNNGVTVVCDEYYETMGSLVMKAPQIVNGCQTAKTLGDFYKHKTNKELSALESNGHLLVKVIKTKRSADESQKKELRDNITRFTNSQNAVRGLDFYALDRFQNGLKDRMKNLGYFYEIQRGAFITLDRKEQESYRGNDRYNYLLGSVNRKKKYVLPAKEVIQSFTAAIKLMPNVAYGRANELTPVGSRWKDIMNEETKGLPLEHFLFPYLILMYAKEELKYKSGSNDFRVNSAFLFIATYYLLITEIVNKHADKEYDSADKINVEVFKDIFNNQNLNKQLLLITNRTLRSFFKDFSIEEAIGDNLRGFVQNKMKKGSTFWIILERKIDHNLEDLEFENIEVYEEIKAIISKHV
ncbi:hypothetical protein C1T30_04960 [Bacillus sp. MBGLi97]|nr:hypothetical protein C1T30_04960 [Bacillus sp. MBGLi97]